MPDLKLSKLPDRAPVKISIAVMPNLNAALLQYLALYNRTYSQDEKLPELIPFMLQCFLDGDRSFAKAQREMASNDPPPPPRRAPSSACRRQSALSDNPSTSN